MSCLAHEVVLSVIAQHCTCFLKVKHCWTVLMDIFAGFAGQSDLSHPVPWHAVKSHVGINLSSLSPYLAARDVVKFLPLPSCPLMSNPGLHLHASITFLEGD